MDLAQSIDGTGFFSSYRYIEMPDPYGNLQGVAGHGLSGMIGKHLAHGSGESDENSRILAYSYYYEDGVIPVQGGVELKPVVDDDNITSFPSLRIKENTRMIFSPSAFSLGNGYYARNPIIRASPLADTTCIKNLDAGMSLHSQIENAKAFQKELEAFADYIDVANASMKLDETITSGIVRIGALQVEELPSFREDDLLLIKKSKPIIEMDAMYIGSLHINKSMFFTVSDDESDEDEYEDEWLPCPCNSVLDSIIAQPIYFNGAKGFGYDVRPVFDCTCPNVLT